MPRSIKKGPFVDEHLMVKIVEMNRRIRRASSTCRPRTRSTARRAFCGEIRTYFTVAFASMSRYLTVVERSPRACERNVRVGANSPSL